MAATTAAVVGGAALVYYGSQEAGKAAGKGAEAMRREAESQRTAILSQGRMNQERATALAESTPQELAILSRSNTSALSNLAREEKMLAAIDPAMMEASQQALQLLRGESAGVTQAMNTQRQSMRQSLVNSLRAQYGPAAESTSIGQRALQKFDMETNSLTQGSNMNALGQVFGIATSDTAARTRAAQGGLMQVGQGYSYLQDRKLNTQINTGNSMLAALSGTSASMIDTAGYGSVANQIYGSGLASIGGNVMTMGAGMAAQGNGTQQPNRPPGTSDPR